MHCRRNFNPVERTSAYGLLGRSAAAACCLLTETDHHANSAAAARGGCKLRMISMRGPRTGRARRVIARFQTRAVAASKTVGLCSPAAVSNCNKVR
jgi:hypothetical protein